MTVDGVITSKVLAWEYGTTFISPFISVISFFHTNMLFTYIPFANDVIFLS